MQEAADDLVSLYKRVSLDDDLDDALRSELLSQLSAGLPYPSTFFSISSNTTKTLALHRCEQHSGHIEAGLRRGGEKSGGHRHGGHGQHQPVPHQAGNI